MSIRTPTYLELYNLINSWNNEYSIPSTKINYYLNSAQDHLLDIIDLPETKTKVALTITDGEADFPTELAGIDIIGYDIDADGRIGSPLTQGDDFRIEKTFNRLTGHTKKIIFYLTPSSTVYAYGKIAIEDFSDTTSITQYAFFESANLILSCAKYLILKDAGVSDLIKLAYDHLTNEISRYRRGRNVNKNLNNMPRNDFGDSVMLSVEKL